MTAGRTWRASVVASAYHIWQQAKKTRAFDGAGKLSLLLSRNRRYSAWYDLPTFGNIALQQSHVLVVDLRCIGAGEGTRLSASKEWPPGLLLRECPCHLSPLLGA